jgi:hypothetical protein
MGEPSEGKLTHEKSGSKSIWSRFSCSPEDADVKERPR